MPPIEILKTLAGVSVKVRSLSMHRIIWLTATCLFLLMLMSTKKAKIQASKSNLVVSYDLPFIEKEDNILIDARLLHQKLKSKQHYADWIKNRIQEFGFAPGEDFFINLRKSLFGRPKKEYHITMNMAKELSMVERSTMGRKIRRYFISAEKELVQKRLYGQSYTMSQIKPNIRITELNGVKLYSYRDAQRQLGYSTKGSLSNVRRCYAHHLAILGRDSYITEDYLRLMITRATARQNAVVTKEKEPLKFLEDFGQQSLPLS